MGEVHYGQMDNNCCSCIFKITKMCNIKCLSRSSTMSAYYVDIFVFSMCLIYCPE